jgi:dipeptidyl aminopeptidase/acylaminoacyl peptidase
VLRRLTAALAVALLTTACQVRQTPAPVSVALLKVGPPTRLTDRAALSPVAWAPDGQALAYADRHGLWIAPLRGRDRDVVATGVATAVDWSRGTGLLAYIDQGKIWVIRPDGSGRRHIPLPPQNGIPPFATHVVWAPGGDRMAVAIQGTGEAPARGRVWLVSADGRFRRLVFEAPAGQVVGALQWFPDSLFLLIGLSPEHGPRVVTRLLRWRIVYPDRRALPLPRAGMFELRLSPNGRWIAFVAPDPSRREGEHVWAMRVDGSGLRRLTSEGGRITSLTWAPASEKVAFAHVLDEARGEVWIADVEGAGRVRAVEFTAEFPDPGLPLTVQVHL